MQLLRSLSALPQCQRRLSGVIAACSPPNVSFQGKGLTPLRSQGSPLRSDPILRYRCGLDKPLTSFTPLEKEQLSGFLRKPSLSIFLLLSTSLSGVYPPENSLFAFF